MHRNRKARMDFVIFLVVAVVFLAIAFAFKTYSTFNTVQTLKFTEDASQLNTHIFVLMNSNKCGGDTTLPMKDIIAQALAQNVNNIETGDTSFTVNYGGVEKNNVNIKSCVEDYANSLNLKEYYFYTTYNGVNKTKIGEQLDGMLMETEYFSVPDASNSIATATLLVKLTPDNYEELPGCPNNGIDQCYPRLTCPQYGGKCDDTRGCSKLKCCCGELPLW